MGSSEQGNRGNSGGSCMWRKKTKVIRERFKRRQSEVTSPHPNPQYQRCKRRHGNSPCRVGQKVCYRCGKSYHIARN